jgi:hypothetical protein
MQNCSQLKKSTMEQEILNKLQEISAELVQVKKQLAESENARYFDNWIPRKKLMEFFDYGDTQIASMFKQGGLVVSEIGNRKFIKKDSVIKLLEKNIK